MREVGFAGCTTARSAADPDDRSSHAVCGVRRRLSLIRPTVPRPVGGSRQGLSCRNAHRRSPVRRRPRLSCATCGSQDDNSVTLPCHPLCAPEGGWSRATRPLWARTPAGRLQRPCRVDWTDSTARSAADWSACPLPPEPARDVPDWPALAELCGCGPWGSSGRRLGTLRAGVHCAPVVPVSGHADREQGRDPQPGFFLNPARRVGYDCCCHG